MKEIFMGLMTIFVQGRCDFVDCQWRARGVDETGLLSKCKQALEGEGFFGSGGLNPDPITKRNIQRRTLNSFNIHISWTTTKYIYNKNKTTVS